MQEQEAVLKLKNEPSINSYLVFLQDVITRMANNSGNVKALISVIYTIVITVLIAVQKLNEFWWLCIIVSISGILMDAYYLAFERMYRKKYNNIVKSINNSSLDIFQIFNMSPKNTELKYEIIAEMIDSIKSFSILGFYLIFIAISIVLKIL